jgi:hypothetical protein
MTPVMAIGMGGHPETLMIGLFLITSDTDMACVGFRFALGSPP